MSTASAGLVPVPSVSPAVHIASALIAAAEMLLPRLARGEAVEARALRDAMTATFGGSDAEGRWAWKDAYEACEIAQLLFLRRFGPAMRARPIAAQLAMLGKVAALLPTHTRRSEESQALQQFSTPVPLGFVAATAAAITSADVVLEPSAGTGLLAVFAGLAGASLVLNELGQNRADLLVSLFPASPVTRFDAAHIDDHLGSDLRPSVVLINPPFSACAYVDGRVADATYRHIASALARLADGGRLVAITGASFSPENPTWAAAFARLQQRGRVVFTAAIDGRVYARHGTTTDTRLTVIDRVTSGGAAMPASLGMAPDTATLLDWVIRYVPTRPACTPSRHYGSAHRRKAASAPTRFRTEPRSLVPVTADAIELVYEAVDVPPVGATRLSEALYEPFALQAIRIPGARPHPTPLVQSAAMASVRPPLPSYRPHLPVGLMEQGLLSDAQLETVVLAGEAHSTQLVGAWTVDTTFDVVSAAPEGAEAAVRFRRGFMLGDGTGAARAARSRASSSTIG